MGKGTALILLVWGAGTFTGILQSTIKSLFGCTGSWWEWLTNPFGAASCATLGSLAVDVVQLFGILKVGSIVSILFAFIGALWLFSK